MSSSVKQGATIAFPAPDRRLTRFMDMTTSPE